MSFYIPIVFPVAVAFLYIAHHFIFRNQMSSSADFHILTSTLHFWGFSHLSSLKRTHAAATVTPP